MSEQVTSELTFSQEMFTLTEKVNNTVLKNANILPVKSTLIVLMMLDSMKELLTYGESNALSIDEKVAIEFMLNDYIPSTIQAFLSVRGDKSSVSENFISQLLILDGKIISMVDAVYAHNSSLLEINGRFLQEKFGS